MQIVFTAHYIIPLLWIWKMKDIVTFNWFYRQNARSESKIAKNQTYLLIQTVGFL